MNKNLLKSLVCPQCRHAVHFNKERQLLECDVCAIGYPVQDDIPIMLIEAAKPLIAES